MEDHQKSSLIKKCIIAGSIKIGDFDKRLEIMQQMERHYAHHVFESHYLMRRLVVPILIKEMKEIEKSRWMGNGITPFEADWRTLIWNCIRRCRRSVLEQKKLINNATCHDGSPRKSI
ncbi:unnamed protein product [Auanema sp. JU1783]|nr:unnamed protein product [Auanema sp. JU1783]